jgi:DNA-binding response OmpR family regulator
MPRILVVDDEIFIRMLYKKEFESEGYEVMAAGGEGEAMAAMRGFRPDLVILDIELSDSNGLELLNRLRQEYRDVVVILNSAYSTYKADFQSWLADAYIMKSSDLNPLKGKVRDLLEARTCNR